MEQWSTVPNELSWQAYWGSRGQSATVGALLSAELALRAYQLDKGIYPEKLDDLVPTYLPQTPIDPCSDTGEPLVYRRTEEGFTLYSRGYDRDEDGGRPPVAAHSWIADGDLSLKEYFKEE